MKPESSDVARAALEITTEGRPLTHHVLDTTIETQLFQFKVDTTQTSVKDVVLNAPVTRIHKGHLTRRKFRV